MMILWTAWDSGSWVRFNMRKNQISFILKDWCTTQAGRCSSVAIICETDSVASLHNPAFLLLLLPACWFHWHPPRKQRKHAQLMGGGCWSLCTTYHIKSCTPQYSWKRTVASKTTDLHDCWRQKLLFGMIKCYINSTHHIGLPLHHPHPAALIIIQWIDSKMPCKLLTVVMRSSPPPQRQPGQGRPRIASTTYTWLCMVAVIPSNSSELAKWHIQIIQPPWHASHPLQYDNCDVRESTSKACSVLQEALSCFFATKRVVPGKQCIPEEKYRQSRTKLNKMKLPRVLFILPNMR